MDDLVQQQETTSDKAWRRRNAWIDEFVRKYDLSTRAAVELYDLVAEEILVTESEVYSDGAANAFSFSDVSCSCCG